MILVLVLTVATAVLADAGYQYNAPSGLFNQPAPFALGPSSQFLNRPTDDNDKPLSHSVSYKDYIYLNKDVANVARNVQTENPLSIQPVAGVVLNKGYAETQSNLHINRGYSYSPPAVRVNTNSGISQTSTLSSVNLNAGYPQTFASQISVPAAGPGVNNNVFAQSLLSSTNLNNAQTYSGYSNGLTQSNSISTGFSSGNIQTSSGAATSSLNNGYSYIQPQASGIQFTSGNAPSSSKLASSNLNSDFLQSVPHSSGVRYSSGRVLNSPVAVSSQNNGYLYSTPQSGAISSPDLSSSLVQPAATNSHFSSGYSNAIASSGSSSSSNAQNTLVSATSNLNSGVAQSAESFSSAGFNNGFNIQETGIEPSTSFASINLAQSSTGTANSGFVQSLTEPANNLNTAFAQQGSVNQAIFRHIYFHVPPPEIEDQRFEKPAPPPKKNYKIIFIKVPSQELKSNLARLQIAQTPNGVDAVEHKTLIYVLVKNPDTPKLAVPKKIPSEHEVFFVKYNGNPLDIAARVNEELDNSGSVQGIVPLEPGLVNGHTF